MTKDKGSEFKLHVEACCDIYGIACKPTSTKNPQASAILERVHQVIMVMLRTAELDMANSVAVSDIDTFLTDKPWVTLSSYHTVLIAYPGAAIFSHDMVFSIPQTVDYQKHQTNLNTFHESKMWLDWDYKIGDRVLLQKYGILCKSDSWHDRDPLTITSGHRSYKWDT